MRTYLAVLTMLAALASGAWANPDGSIRGGWTEQPDGTILHYVSQYDTMWVDGYVVVYGSDGWYYYAELDVRGEYVASPYKVGIDDPAEIGIPRYLQRQRSAVRQAEIDAENISINGVGHRLYQPDGTGFLAYGGAPLPTGSFGWCTSLNLRGEPIIPADGYVIEIEGKPLINYGDGEPFWAFVYDDESGWYYYAERLDPYREYEEGYAVNQQGYILDAQGEYVASPYKVGIEDPPYYDRPTDAIEPPTVVQEHSWGAVKHLFHK